MNLLRYDRLIIGMMVVGMAQYGQLAINSIAFGEVTLWAIDADAADQAGLVRYVKDTFLLLLGVYWPLYVLRLGKPPWVSQWLLMYFAWISAVLTVGLTGYVFELSPLLFLVAGLRWLMLLHAAFGLFLLAGSVVLNDVQAKRIFYCLLMLALLDLVVVIQQLRLVGLLHGLSLGQSRLTGFFNNAGTAGFFGLAVALLVMQLETVAASLRLVVILLALLIALSSGTRFVAISIFLIAAHQVNEAANRGPDVVRRVKPLLLLPIFGVSAYFGYVGLIDMVDRGGVMSEAVEQGGRISNFKATLEALMQADVGELMFGRGLGLGTNTAETMLLAQGLDPRQYRFHWLVDNALLTSLLQFGVLGALVFWAGLVAFIKAARPILAPRTGYWLVVAIFVLTCLAGTPFEHFYLMLSYSAALGMIFWRSLSSTTERAR